MAARIIPRLMVGGRSRASAAVLAGGSPSPQPSPARGEGADRGDAPTTQSSVLSPQSSVVGYVGLLSPDRGLATVYEAACLLRQRLPEAGVRVIGRVDWSGLPASVPRDPAAWAAAGVELAGTIPADAVPAALDQIAVGWIPFRDTGNNRRTIPLKLLEYMAAGKPVVASAIGFIATIVRESGCGVLVPPDDPAAHAAALAALLADPKEQQ
ncbi:MAG: glycosyltransferase, partial [Dehalococcoidia bacterium]